MPSVFGYKSDQPLYWWHNTNKTYTKFAEDWSDALDGSILVSQGDGTGIESNVWTGSNADGTFATYACKDDTYNAYGWYDGTGSDYGKYGAYGYTDGSYLFLAGSALCNASWPIRCACQKAMDLDE